MTGQGFIGRGLRRGAGGGAGGGAGCIELIAIPGKELSQTRQSDDVVQREMDTTASQIKRRKAQLRRMVEAEHAEKVRNELKDLLTSR